MRNGIPIFFKLWFAFVAAMALSIFVATVYVLAHPAYIGEYVGQMVQGFHQAQ